MSSDEQEPTRRPRLIRTRRGRLLGGVCSGLGAHFDVDPILFRIAFVGLAIFSGVGIVLYLAILLLTPEEGASRAPIRLRRAAWRSALGFVVTIVAVGIALHAVSHAGLGSAWRFGVGLGWLVLVGGVAALIWLRLRGPANRWNASGDRRLFGLLALGTALVVEAVLLAAAGAWLAGIDERVAAWTVGAIGMVLVVATFTGGAHRLMLPAVAFALAVAVIAAAHVDLHGGMGERVYRPRTLNEVREGYRLGAGRLEIDLRGIAFPLGNTKLHVRLGMGEARRPCAARCLCRDQRTHRRRLCRGARRQVGGSRCRLGRPAFAAIADATPCVGRAGRAGCVARSRPSHRTRLGWLGRMGREPFPPG